MKDHLSNAKRWIREMKEQRPDFRGLEFMTLEAGAVLQVPRYVKELQAGPSLIVADANTYEAAGKRLERLLAAEGLDADVCLLKPDKLGDVVADELSIMQLFVAANPERTGCLIAVGSGTIHDITRFVAHRTGKPFISVPTAPSVDGFTSLGAPIIVRGVKQTFPASAPIAIFADLDVLIQAPQPLVAAGFGDMLGKYTSLFDWKFSAVAGREPYDEQAADITGRALDACVRHAREIGERSEEGIIILMTALIESGIAMLLFGQSHPASGAEHHLSHYWEMEYLRRGNRALLHGAKVGVACGIISRLYHDAADKGIFPYEKPKEWEALGELTRTWLAEVPAEEEIAALLDLVGGPSSLEQLGIDRALLEASLREAHTLRNRRTLLRTLNEAKAE